MKTTLTENDFKSFLTSQHSVEFLSVVSRRLCNMMQTEAHLWKAHNAQKQPGIIDRKMSAACAAHHLLVQARVRDLISTLPMGVEFHQQ